VSHLQPLSYNMLQHNWYSLLPSTKLSLKVTNTRLDKQKYLLLLLLIHSFFQFCLLATCALSCTMHSQNAFSPVIFPTCEHKL